MQIYLKLPDGKQHTYEVERGDTLEMFMENMADKDGPEYNMSNYRFVFGGRQFSTQDLHKTMNELNIGPDSTITSIERLRGGGNLFLSNFLTTRSLFTLGI